MLNRDSNSVVIDLDGQSLKEFGQLLLAKIWQRLDLMADRFFTHSTQWEGFQAAAYRETLRVMSSNCSRSQGSPASLRWPSLSMFVGVGNGFQVLLDQRVRRVVLTPTADMMRALGYANRLLSPFLLPAEYPKDAEAEKPPVINLTPMSEMHWPLRDDSQGGGLKFPTITNLQGEPLKLMDHVPSTSSDETWATRPTPPAPLAWDAAGEFAGKVADGLDDQNKGTS